MGTAARLCSSDRSLLTRHSAQRVSKREVRKRLVISSHDLSTPATGGATTDGRRLHLPLPLIELKGRGSELPAAGHAEARCLQPRGLLRRDGVIVRPTIGCSLARSIGATTRFMNRSRNADQGMIRFRKGRPMAAIQRVVHRVFNGMAARLLVYLVWDDPTQSGLSCTSMQQMIRGTALLAAGAFAFAACSGRGMGSARCARSRGTLLLLLTSMAAACAVAPATWYTVIRMTIGSC